jgi:hypothetical protein
VEFPPGLETEWIRFAANNIKFEGEKLELEVSLNGEERRKKMREKIVCHQPWIGAKKTAML